MNINTSKKNARLKFKEIRRKALFQSQSEIFNQVQNTLRKLIIQGKDKGFIGIYWPLPGEIDLREIKNNLDIPLA